ncbi:MAG: hypothetical protein F6K56_30720 [Moorea sp. SIO3G5]|nr:hypothetical protein [Moorena sp. SIO3G5]
MPFALRVALYCSSAGKPDQFPCELLPTTLLAVRAYCSNSAAVREQSTHSHFVPKPRIEELATILRQSKNYSIISD